jgi:hypothetical protein
MNVTRSNSAPRRRPINQGVNQIGNPHANFNINQQPSLNSVQSQPEINTKNKHLQQPEKYIQQPPKMSISDAIGLTTLRLLKIEQYLQTLQENDNTQQTDTTFIPINTNDSAVFEIINNRLNTIESTINNYNKLQERLLKCEKDLTDTTNLLIKCVLKQETFTTTTTESLNELLVKTNTHDAYILEQQQQLIYEEQDNLQTDILEEDIVISEHTNTEMNNNSHV